MTETLEQTRDQNELTQAPQTNGVAEQPYEHQQAAVHKGPNLDTKLAVKLQNSIDHKGRYSYQLGELALGYAAGAGIKEHQAKEEIKEIFQNQIGMEIQDYLEMHREENGLSVDRDNRDNGYER